MRIKNNEIFFKNRNEALKYLEELKSSGTVLYTCVICGISFGSADPYTSEGGIICAICVKTMNFFESDNYRPEDDIEFEI